MSKDFPFTPEEAITYIKSHKLDLASNTYAYQVKFIEATGIVLFWLRDEMLRAKERERVKRANDQSVSAMQQRILKLKMRGF